MSPHLPFFSVVIATYARPKQLAACLQSLTRLDYPRENFEVIVVDDGSETPPLTTVAAVSAQIDVRMVTQARAGPATARNTGVEHARGEFIAFTDDDCAPAADWLRRLAGHLHADPDRMLGGHTINSLRGNLFSDASQLLVDYLYAYYGAAGKPAGFFTSNNMALQKGRFQMTGGFDTTYPFAAAEDRELCDRWLQLGYRMEYAADAVVYHAHALKLRSFWRQHLHYGRGAYQFHATRARRTADPIRVEPLRFYLNLLRYPFDREPTRRAIALSALFTVAQAANTIGFFWERARGLQ